MKLYEFFNVSDDSRKKPDPHFDHISAEEKQKMADEVFWFILDHDALHKEYVLPVVGELKSQIEDPKFDREKFNKQWSPMVSKGCSLFYKKEKLSKDPKNLFDDELKDELCKRLTDKFAEEVKDDVYQVGGHSL
jgi:hypothetical protein